MDGTVLPRIKKRKIKKKVKVPTSNTTTTTTPPTTTTTTPIETTTDLDKTNTIPFSSDHDEDEDLPAASRYGVVSNVSPSGESSADPEAAAEGAVSSAAAAVEEAVMEDKDGLDTTLTDLLEDVDLEKLEEIMEELLPIEGVKQAAAALAMSTGQGQGDDELTPEKGDDTSLEYLDYEEEEDEVEDEVSDVFSVQDVEDNSANPSAQGDETEYFGNSVNACPVKKEILQPFWATNSRGETLALMNVAPLLNTSTWNCVGLKRRRCFARRVAGVSSSTDFRDCWPTTQTTSVEEFSQSGSGFLHSVF